MAVRRAHVADAGERAEGVVVQIVAVEEHARAVCERGDQPLRRVEGDDRAAVHDRDAIAQRLGLVEVVRGQDHGPAGGGDAADHVPEVSPRLRVEAGRRLVEEHDLRVVHERERDREPLLLPAREPARRGLPFLGEADQLEQPLGASSGRHAVERREQVEELARGEVLEERRGLQLHADPALDPRRVRPDRPAQDRRAPGVWHGQPLDHLERRRLAGAVRPEDPERLARRDRERHVTYRVHVAEALLEVLGDERRRRAHCGARPSAARTMRSCSRKCAEVYPSDGLARHGRPA